MAYETVIFERKGHTAVVTMNRPERLNAYNEQLHADLRDSWDEVNEDDNIWSVVVTGAGRAFCTGADMREASAHMSKGQLGAPRWEKNVDFLRMFNEITGQRKGLGLPMPDAGYPAKPLIGAVNSLCVGDGMWFLYCCDFIVCSDDCKIFDPHVNVAISPPGIILLPRQIPRTVGFATMMLGLNYRMEAQRAYELGLVTEVVPLGQLMERALELAEEINTHSAPLTTRAIKAAFWTTLGQGYETARPWAAVFDHQARYRMNEPEAGRKSPPKKSAPRARAKK